MSQISNSEPTEFSPYDFYLGFIEVYRFCINFASALYEAMEVEHHPGYTPELMQGVNDLAAQTFPSFDAFVHEQLRVLLDDRRWQELVSRPDDFNAELDQTLDLLRRFMRVKYGLADHRPTTLNVRDARIVLLRLQGLTFDETGATLGIGKSAAHGAFERQLEQFDRFGRIIRAMYRLAKQQPDLLIGPSGERLDISCFAPSFD